MIANSLEIAVLRKSALLSGFPKIAKPLRKCKPIGVVYFSNRKHAARVAVSLSAYPNCSVRCSDPILAGGAGRPDASRFLRGCDRYFRIRRHSDAQVSG